MSNPFLENLYPDEDEGEVFNNFYRTLERFGVVQHMSMYVSDGDNGGCGNEQCCGGSSPVCEVEIRVRGKYHEYDIY